MGIIKQNDAETGTNGVAVDTSNSSGTNNDAWFDVGGVGISPPTYSNTAVSGGTLSLKLTSASGVQPYLNWQLSPSQPTLYFSIRVFFPTTVWDAQMIWCSSGGGSSSSGSLSTSSGKVVLLDRFASVVATSNTSIPANKWVRLEFKIITNTSGTLECKIYINENDITPTETIQTTADTASAVDSVSFLGDWNTTNVVYYDTIVIRDDTYPEPPYNKMTTAWLRF